jgi:hypothetical protein
MLAGGNVPCNVLWVSEGTIQAGMFHGLVREPARMFHGLVSEPCSQDVPWVSEGTY